MLGSLVIEVHPLGPNLLTPILSPTTPEQRRYNRAFLYTRKNIECAFGRWKNIWRSMDKTGEHFAILRNECVDWQL